MPNRNLNLGLDVRARSELRAQDVGAPVHHRRVSVLMYHAVLGADTSTQAADPHYAVSEAAFGAQLRTLAELGRHPCAVRDLFDRASAVHRHPGGAVAFTFDDGHISNLAAAQRLAAIGARADFFINPGHVGEPGLLDWAALRDMLQMGMSIQSHGWQHRYLDALAPRDLRESLYRSKEEIEQKLATRVTLFAPPGGRVVPGLAAMATTAGYRAVCSSRAGVWSTARGGREVPRLAVLASTSIGQYRRWAAQQPLELATQWLRERTLRAAKGVLGNGRYEQARQRLLKSPTSAHTKPASL
jgi:peptidoglycan/xylan/chitin deacetylase (PgdA/CDA1 family)